MAASGRKRERGRGVCERERWVEKEGKGLGLAGAALYRIEIDAVDDGPGAQSRAEAACVVGDGPRPAGTGAGGRAGSRLSLLTASGATQAVTGPLSNFQITCPNPNGPCPNPVPAPSHPLARSQLTRQRSGRELL